MKNIIVVVLALFYSAGLLAQAEVQYSQFIFNKLAFNPAYAGSKETLTLGAIYRHQWQGVNGAPRTFSAYTHAPFSGGKSGAALAITSDRIGIVENSYIDLSYAYRIPLGQGKLSLGLQTRFEYSQIDWLKTELVTPDDNVIPGGESGRTGVNFGTGVYYSTSNFYVGLSAPQLLRNNLYTDNSGVQSAAILQSYYLMGGVVTRVSENVLFKPAMMISYSPNAPFELDLNASFLFMNAFWLGATYRLGDSMDAVMQFQLSPQLKLGIATDFTLSELRNYTDGSFEVSLEYIFLKEIDGVNNIRYF
jgi:type IX secretion system PorP/SprF family membrane protein